MIRRLLLAVATVGVILAAPALASANWVGRTMKDSGGWYAIHYNMYNFAVDCYVTNNPGGYCGGVEVFASAGNPWAVPYKISLMGENTGTVYCITSYENIFGAHYQFPAGPGCGFNTITGNNGTRWLSFPEPMRCRVLVPNYGGLDTVGYYCREVAIQRTW